ncbi:AzlC family ABC transporter permease [Termitidicoccus mucosus]|uniref:AzlC family ABC transporter permease n=1 Tax=Termitidicoccus mucosus TaxID=1184151 RepID=UPI0008392789
METFPEQTPPPPPAASAAGPNRRAEYADGFRRMLPLWAGVFPFGMIYGVLALECGLAPWQAQAMSSLVFAGSSQIVLCQLLAASAPLLVVFTAIAIINLRHILYSASLAPSLRALPPWWKAVLAYFLTDEAYATTLGRMTDPDDPSRFRHWHLLGAGTGLWLCWQIATLTGILLGRGVPPEWGLDFAIPLTFIAIVVPRIKTRSDWAAVITSGIAVIVFASLPFKLSLIAATFAGVLAGMWLTRRANSVADANRAAGKNNPGGGSVR